MNPPLEKTIQNNQNGDIVNSVITNTEIVIDEQQQIENKSIFKYILYTVICVLVILIITPVISEEPFRQGYGVGPGEMGSVLLNGLQYTPELTIVSGAIVAATGFLGILGGSISWFWFIGFMFLLLFINKSSLSKIKYAALNIFFLLCIYGVTIIFPGSRSAWDIDCSCHKVHGALGGGFIFM